jgi:hypothetical protein
MDITYRAAEHGGCIYREWDEVHQKQVFSTKQELEEATKKKASPSSSE